MERITKQIFKVLFLLLISSTLFITSCDEDEDDDPIIGTWILMEAVDAEGATIYTATQLALEGISMTVTFTESKYHAVGSMGDGAIDETGTWDREDKNTVIIHPPGDDEDVTLTKDGEYYLAPLDDGVYGKFEKQ